MPTRRRTHKLQLPFMQHVMTLKRALGIGPPRFPIGSSLSKQVVAQPSNTDCCVDAPAAKSANIGDERIGRASHDAYSGQEGA